MGHTVSKLEEARFFLDKLELHRNAVPEFDYYLSAFISSARSLLWVMRAEYHNVDGWEDWYHSQVPTADETELLKKINDIRVRSEKIRPLRTVGFWQLEVPRETLEKFAEAFEGSKEIHLIMEEVGENEKEMEPRISRGEAQFRAKTTQWFRELPELPQVEILDVCKRYYCLLEGLVLECDRLFGSSSEESRGGTILLKPRGYYSGCPG